MPSERIELSSMEGHVAVLFEPHPEQHLANSEDIIDAKDAVENIITSYCVCLSLKLGFSTFVPRKSKDPKTPPDWHPSTAFIAANSLTAALRDVGSRVRYCPEPSNQHDPRAVGDTGYSRLAAAARQLHAHIFQPYGTWKKAVQLADVKKDAAQPVAASREGSLDALGPEASLLHEHLVDLALWWLVYTESANLRLTPELLWFIFYCAQCSSQTQQILRAPTDSASHHHHIALLLNALDAPSLLSRAASQLHSAHRRTAWARRHAPPEPPSFNASPAIFPKTQDRAGVATVTLLVYPASPSPDKGPQPAAEGTIAEQSGRGSSSAAGGDDSPAGSSSGCSPIGPPNISQTPSRGNGAQHSTGTLSSSSCSSPDTGLYYAKNGGLAGHPPGLPASSYRQLLLGLFAAAGVGDFGSGELAAAVDESLAVFSDEGEGTGSAYVTRVVQPLFHFLSEQIFSLARQRRGEALEAALRVSYDDVTESMAHPDVVAAVLEALGCCRAAAPASDGARGAGRVAVKVEAEVGGNGKDEESGTSDGAGRGDGLQGSSDLWYQLLGLADRESAATSTAPANDMLTAPHQGAAAADDGLPLRPSELPPRISLFGSARLYPQQVRQLLGSCSVSPVNANGGHGGPGRGGAAVTSDPEAVGGYGNGGNVIASSLPATSGLLLQPLNPKAGTDLSLPRRADAGAAWWGAIALRKTFVEHRSVGMPLVAFGRLVVFQLVWFYLLCAWLWGGHDAPRWLAGAAAVHWGACCMLWTLQASLSITMHTAEDEPTGTSAPTSNGTPSTSHQSKIIVPYFHHPAYKAAAKRIAAAANATDGRHSGSTQKRAGSRQSVVASSGSTVWWVCQGAFLVVCWSLLVGGLLLSYRHRSEDRLYRWFAVGYGGLVVLYELLWRQCNLGGFSRGHMYDALQRMLPGSPRITTASSAASPMYDPSIHLRTSPACLLGNTALWAVTLGLKFFFDYFLLVKPATSRMRGILATDALAIREHDGSGRIAVDLDPLLAAMQAVLLFLLSLVTTGVAYSLASAGAGALLGLHQGIGSVRNWHNVRSGFTGLQSAVKDKLLQPTQMLLSAPSGAADREGSLFPSCPDAIGSRKHTPSTSSRSDRLAASLRTLKGMVPPPERRVDEEDETADETKEAAWAARESTLALTAPIWNALVRSLRARDLLSDRETKNLTFSPVPSLSPSVMLGEECRLVTAPHHHQPHNNNNNNTPHMLSRRGSVMHYGHRTMNRRYDRTALSGSLASQQDTYLAPLAVYVAQIPSMLSSNRPTSEQLEVLEEAHVYLLSLLVAVGAMEPPSGDLTGNPAVAAVAAMPLRSPSKEHMAAGARGIAGDRAERRRERLATGGQTVPWLVDGSDGVQGSVQCVDAGRLLPGEFAGLPVRAHSDMEQAARRALLDAVKDLLKALVTAVQVYVRTTPDSASSSTTPAAQNQQDVAVESLGTALHGVVMAMAQLERLPPAIADLVHNADAHCTFLSDPVLDRMHSHLATLATTSHRGSSGGGAQQAADTPPKWRTVSSGRVFGWGVPGAEGWGPAAVPVPFREDFLEVASWLQGILAPTDEGTAPSSTEAVSLVAEFCCGLANPAMPAPPPVSAMRSVTTLIPHYEETVLYALSTADAQRVLPARLAGKVADEEVLFLSDCSASPQPSQLLIYLMSEFPEELEHLLERCGSTIKILEKGEQPYNLYDFLPNGRLYEHRAQLLLWASFRGQTLARTVDGMSMYRTALALQAVTDALAAHDANEARQRQQQHAGGYVGAQQGGITPRPQSGHLGTIQEETSREVGLAAAEASGLRAAGGGEGEMNNNVQDVMGVGLHDYGGGDGPGNRSSLLTSGGALRLSRTQASYVRQALRDPELPHLEQLVDYLITLVPPLGPLLDAKYSTLVASQVLASLAASGQLKARWCAHSVALLATRYPSMRVAYLEPVEELTLLHKPRHSFKMAVCDSALVRAMGLEAELELEVERARSASADRVEGDVCFNVSRSALWQRRHCLVDLKAAELEVLFRLRMPLNLSGVAGSGVILGEGKPENQNSAMPYCTGVLVQAIDMNQDNTLAQALKLRNITCEFEPPANSPHQHVAIVGYPEWIFSYRCGLLADLAAASERSFGTQIQRVMATPSAVRAHYGHPDLWNKLFCMTRGGVSKANSTQHVSEDVFGGFNALRRGGQSKYVSYMSVGKGRDMGFDSILGFEGKISKGCAEMLLSRDMRFMAAHTDFFRCMSLFATGPGHFVSTWVTVFTIQAGLWVQLLMVLAGVGKSDQAVASAVGAVQILQLGTLPLLSFLSNLWLELGLGAALNILLRHLIGGGLLFHIFRSVTSAFHLSRAMLFGGASYVATGRGFSLERKSLTQVYYNYGRSHMYLGADILLLNILILVAGNNGGNALPVPAVALWSSFLVAAALLVGPFWFTPYYFKLKLVRHDAREFLSWVGGSSAAGVSTSWEEWNREQLSSLRNDARAQVPLYRLWSTLTLLLPRGITSVLTVLVAVSGARFGSAHVPDLAWVLGGSAVTWVAVGLWSASKRAYRESGLTQGWRWAKGVVQVTSLCLVVVVALFALFIEQRGLRFSGILITLYANYCAASLALEVAVLWLPRSMLARQLSNSAFRQTDAVLGMALSFVLVTMCFIVEIGLVMLDRVLAQVQFNDRYHAIWVAGQQQKEAACPGGGVGAQSKGAKGL